MVTDTLTPARPELNAKNVLLPYSLALIALCVINQVVIAVIGNVIDWRACLMTGVIALYYAIFLITKGKELQRIRFASLVAHAITYVAVVGSFQLHAAFLLFANSDQIRGTADFPIDPGWAGPTFFMAGFWSIGLIIHAIASIAYGGYEH